MMTVHGQIRIPWKVLCLFFSLTFLCIGKSHGAEKAEALLTVSDALTTPGQTIKLQARLWVDSLIGQVGLGGESLEFSVGQKPIGTAMTGGDGRAFLEITPRMRGNLIVTARLSKSPRVVDVEGKGTLAVWERRRPILLIDFAAIMQQKGRLRSPLPVISEVLKTNTLPDPEVDAPHELEKLGKFYFNLMYVFRSESGDRTQIKEWLREHKFPTGNLQIIKNGSLMLKQFITQLKDDGWENVSAGIGRTEDFAEVLGEQRLKAVIVHEQADKEDFPRRAIVVKTWKKVRRYL